MNSDPFLDVLSPNSPFASFSCNEPFGSRPEPGIYLTASTLQLPPGEVPKGRAELVLSLCAYARQRTLEPVLEPGVTGVSIPLNSSA